MIKRHALVGEIADHQALPARVVVVRGVGSHTGAGCAGVAISHSSRDTYVGEGSVVVVVVELVGFGVVGDEQIQPAVIVIIQQRNAECLAGGIVETSSLGHVLKRSISLIVEKGRALTFISLRRAVGLVFVVERAVLIGLNRPLDVVSDEQIQLAIVVVVKPYRADENPGSATPAFAVTSANLPLPRL